MPVARPESGETRVIAHLDLDCFYVQVEQRKRPQLRGKPVAVVQFNPWKGGGLIAVSYEARKCGVTRNMRGDDAKKLCPDIELVQVPMAHGHAFLSPYRDAGSEVVAVLSRGGICERASIDEVYLDITDAAAARLLKDPPSAVESLSEEARKTHILGLREDGEEAMTTGEWLCQSDSSRSDALLACGAMIVAELRTAVLAETQFTCSAGIGHNKMLAKLTSSMHKPAQQTVIPSSYVPTLLASLPLKKIGQLGGKLGKSLQEELGVKTPGDMLPYSESKLQELYGVNTGTWLWNIARGKNGDEVKGRVLPKSHSCGKTFAGPKALKDMTSVMHWLGEMCEELQERLDTDLEMNNRSARLLVFHAGVHLRGGSQPARKFPSKSCPLRYGKERILADARVLFERGLRDFCPPNQSLSPVKGTGHSGCNWAVTSLSIGASGISAVPTGVNPITSFFSAPAPSEEPKRSPSPPASPPHSTAPSATDLESRGGDSGTRQASEGFEFGSSSGTLSTHGSFVHFDDSATDPEVEPMTCTPKFGSVGSPVHHRSLFQVTDGGSLGHDDAPSPVGGPAAGRGADPAAAEPTLIQCSPVEDPVPSSSWGEFGGEGPERRRLDSNTGTDSAKARGSTSGADAAAGRADGSHPGDEIRPTQTDADTGEGSSEGEASRRATRVIQPRLSFPPPKSPAKPPPPLPGGSGAGAPAAKLQDFWQRSATPAPAGSKRPPGTSWEYLQDEIDEEVLAQLPAEIQKELRDSLKLGGGRPRPPKRPTISDFFPSSK